MSSRLFWAIENSNLFVQKIRDKQDKDSVNDQAKSGLIPIVENIPKEVKYTINLLISEGHVKIVKK